MYTIDSSKNSSVLAWTLSWNRGTYHDQTFKTKKGNFLSHQILIMESEQGTFDQIKAALGFDYSLNWGQSIDDASQRIQNEHFDLLILPTHSAQGSPVDLALKISQSRPDIPILFIGESKNIAEKILCFSAGADDFIQRPINPLELKTRVDARIRKVKALKSENSHHRWKELEVDAKKQEVLIYPGAEEKPIEGDLTALEFKLLLYFVEHKGDVLHRDTILNAIWGEDIHVYSRSVDTHVSKLRKKLGAAASTIESVHGSGYKFSPTPSEILGPEELVEHSRAAMSPGA